MNEVIELEQEEKVGTLDEFTLGFIWAALWSSTDKQGRPIDDNYSIADFSKTAIQAIIKDCENFQNQHHETLKKLYDSARVEGSRKFETEHAGHDYWLVRNGHAPSFWNQAPSELTEELNKISIASGPSELIVQDHHLLEVEFKTNKKQKKNIKK